MDSTAKMMICGEGGIVIIDENGITLCSAGYVNASGASTWNLTGAKSGARCRHCGTYGQEDAYHKGTCGNCGAPIDPK